MRSFAFVLVFVAVGCSRSSADATTTTTTASTTAAATTTTTEAQVEPPYAVRGGVMTQADSSQFEKVGKAFMEDLIAERYDLAYARTTHPYRAVVTLDEFRAATSKNPFFQGGASVEALPASGGGSKYWDSNSSLTWSYKAMSWGRWVVAFHAANGDAHGTIEFVKEGGDWLVSGVTIGGMPGLPSYSEPPRAGASPAKKR